MKNEYIDGNNTVYQDDCDFFEYMYILSFFDN